MGAWPAFTNQQVADAKPRACAAYTTVRTGVSLQTHATGAADPVATPTVAVDARLSEVASAQYLLNRLDPATPPPLAAAIHTFADDLLDIAANALAGAPNDDPAQAGRLRDGETASAHSGSVQMSPDLPAPRNLFRDRHVDGVLPPVDPPGCFVTESAM